MDRISDSDSEDAGSIPAGATLRKKRIDFSLFLSRNRLKINHLHDIQAVRKFFTDLSLNFYESSKLN